MAKFIFITDNDDCREASKIEFEVPNDLTIFEFKNMCIRMASAMGYHHNTILKAFETTKEKDKIDDEIYKLLMYSSKYHYNTIESVTGSYSP